MARNRKNNGWARTKFYPHKKHPAYYVRTNGDDIEYITFTHSEVVDFGNKKVRTVPLSDNISEKERKSNIAAGNKRGANRTYAVPTVYEGKRSSLHKETNEFSPTEFDKKRIDKMFKFFPKEKVPLTGGKQKFNKNKRRKNKKRKRPQTQPNS